MFRPLKILEKLIKRKIFGNRHDPTSKVENSVKPVEVKTILPTSAKCESIADVSDKKSVEKICPVCGKSFISKIRRQKYCSRQCKIKASNAKYQKKSTPVEKTCPTCGKSFETQNSRKKYCSERCRQKAVNAKYQKKSTPVEKTCPTCGKSFETQNRRQKYCSVECRDLANNKRSRDRLKPAEKICPVCGKTFIARRKQIYCSPWCGGERTAKVPEHIELKPVKKKPEKSLEQWMQEAKDCGMSYGKYRAAVERLGKTYDELKIKW